MTGRRQAVVLAAALVLAVPAAAAQGASAQTITAVGNGQAKVKPANPNNNASIVRAVASAYSRSVPRAIAAARADGQRLASASGLVLGGILSVDENVNGASGYYYGPANFGRFGPNQYCGTLVRRVHRRDSAGVLHTIRRKQHKCYVPEFAFSTLAVTFSAAPPAS